MPNPTLAAFKNTITVAWPRHQDAAAKAHLLSVAADGHARIMRDAGARAGVAPDFDAWANTPNNTNLQSVKLPGPIVYRYRYVREVVKEALKQLKAASPRRSGLYERSHSIFINGTRVETLPATLKFSDEIMLSNPVPYARKIEVGKTKSGRAFLISVPNRIYERTARRIKSRYGQLVSVESRFVTLPGAYALKRATGRTRSKRAGASLTSPAIIIRAL